MQIEHAMTESPAPNGPGHEMTISLLGLRVTFTLSDFPTLSTTHIEELIMGIKEDFNASQAAVVARISELETQVARNVASDEALRGAVGDLSIAASTTKDALEALREQVAAGNGGALTVADIQAAIDINTGALARVDAVKTQLEASAAADATAATEASAAAVVIAP